jgi:hypothetical protein
MSDGRRPGGLTVLAVLNFVFGCFGVIGIIGLVGILAVADAETRAEFTRALGSEPGSGTLALRLLLEVAAVGLMLAAGVGYLGMRRFLGRTIGNAYATLSLVGTALVLAMSAAAVNLGVLIGVTYPIVTLILLNTTFKDDLVR